ncbi:MAG: type 1 glutamine amidotransferase [Phycisphaeraceae bacterium]|nr:type 1 glutamine amidotransferase [Phycisphaeraceae bacterium]
MANIIVLQHSEIGGPGRLGATLRDHGFRLDIRRVDLPPEKGGAPPPADLDNVQGVVSLGGPQSANDPFAWVAREQAFLRLAHEAELPVIGVCLGSQMLGKALGGEVRAMARPEVGFQPIRVEVAGQTDTIMAGVPWSAPRLSIHGDEVSTLPAGATLLSSSQACRVQAWKIGLRTYAFQHHFEADRAMALAMFGSEPELLARAGVTLDGLKSELDRHYDRFATIADRLCLNIAAFAFPYSSLLSA